VAVCASIGAVCMSIRENLNKIEERIINACMRSGRLRQEIQILAVSKYQSFERIQQARDSGLRLFGENRVQEAREKFGQGTLKKLEEIELHLIGTLQRNKVKMALELFDCFQSVDRDELVQELGKRANPLTPIPILFELHTGEDSKAGYPSLDALLKGVEAALHFPSLKIQGLMTMAPFTEEKSRIRESFRTLVKAQQTILQCFPEVDCSVLSMGMSNDFEIAIEEGSTLLRIGTALFKDV
jgi:pyridoxal phosphate enzyme (YggS family)